MTAAERLADGPLCAHMRVNYDPEEIASEFGPAMQSRWKCSECGLLFIPAPPVDVEACVRAARRVFYAKRSMPQNLEKMWEAAIIEALREAGVVKP